MVRRIAIALLLLGSMIAMALPASAGGWAAVRVVSHEVNPNNPEAWTITVVVLQHDVTPNDDVDVTAHFVNAETGATLEVAGVATGAPGEFRFEVKFPEGGSWNWSASPAPFPTVNMAVLDVGGFGETAVGAILEGTIWGGNCLNLGIAIESFPVMRSVHKNGAVVDSGIVPAYDIVVEQASETGFALTVYGHDGSETVKTCREVKAIDNVSPLTMPELTPAQPTGASWTLLPNQDGTAATFISVLDVATNRVTVAISDTGGGSFDPPSLTVPVGTTVTWVNKSTIAHTISGLTVGFASSGMLDPNQLFSQTFNEPGTFPYKCDPHAGMTGTITVTG